MSGDDKELRDVLITEIDEIAPKLVNGGATDPTLLARGVALSLRLLKPVVQRITVSDDECKRRMALCPAHAILSGNTESAGAALVKLIERWAPWAGIVGYLTWKSQGG